MNPTLLVEQALYFVALINPASKVMVLSALSADTSPRELAGISVRSSFAAALILAILAAGGHFILHQFFHVEIYALRVAGGVVLFTIGLHALQKGRFFELDAGQKLSDVSIVPLAAPMIAGPATMTAAISSAADPHYGLPLTLVALCVAIAMNLVVMVFAGPIERTLSKVSLMGPLIRITGLIVAAIAVQMVFDGVREWLGLLQQAPPAVVPATQPTAP